MTYLRIVGDVHQHYKMYESAVKDVPYSIQLGDMGMNYAGFPKLDPSRHVFIGGNHDDYTLGERPDLTIDDPSILEPGSKLTVIQPNENFCIPEDEKYQIHLKKCLPSYEEPTVCEFVNLPQNCLGNFGIWEIPDTDVEAFYVRGAWSIDGSSRRKYGWGWYAREQLAQEECEAALKLYEKKKPIFVITHAAPISVMSNLRLYLSDGQSIASATNRLLQFMFEAHQPQLWIFAHFHQYWQGCIGSTEFVCLDHFPNYEYGWTIDFDKSLGILGFDMHEVGPFGP